MDIRSYSGLPGRRLDAPRFFRCALVAMICAVAATLIKLGTDSLLGQQSPWLLYLAGVLVAAWYGGSDAGLMATPLSIMAGHAPRLVWDDLGSIPSAGEGFHLVLFLAEGILVSHFVGSLKAARRDAEDVRTELAGAHDASIEAWGKILDLRDRETEGHSLRVAEMTVRVAREMGIGEDELVHVRRGALLHDIGKMGIPDAILHKPGPLTPLERASMQRHPRLANDWLGSIPFLSPALDIPYCHHERWDGNGYPQGLHGEETPLSARIFAVVDVWDALRSNRPYRARWSEDRVREHIRSLAGTHLDPVIVPTFLDLIGQEEDADSDVATTADST